MNILSKYNYKELFRGNAWFISFMAFFCVAFFIVQNINHRFWMHDYEVYYSAANSLLHGEKVYGVSYGLSSGFYKYSPFALLIFAPFSLLPFYAAKVLHFIILSVSITAVILLSAKIVKSHFFPDSKLTNINLLLFLIFLPILPNVYTELHLGNINSILLLIFIIALRYLLKGKELKAGLLLALGILIKPHFIIFLPLLLFRKKFKCLFYTVAGIISGLILPAVFTGIKYNIELHRQWLTTMQLHNNSLIDGQYTIFSWLYRSVGHFFFSDTIHYDKAFGIIIISLIAIAFIMLLIFHLKKERTFLSSQLIKEGNFVFEYFLLLAIVPNITVTDSEHFLLSIPLIAIIIHFLFEKKGTIAYKIIGIICLVMFGFNMRDIVGADISSFLSSYGILGLANFLIILFCIVIHVKQIHQKNHKYLTFLQT